MDRRRGRCFEVITDILLENFDILITGFPARYVPTGGENNTRSSPLVPTGHGQFQVVCYKQLRRNILKIKRSQLGQLSLYLSEYLKLF